MTDRLSNKISRYRHADAEEPNDTVTQRAKREIERENLLLWAYYTSTEWPETRVASHVIERAAERPPQVAISRIIHAVDTDVLHRELSLGYSLSGQWFSTETSTDDIPEPQRQLLKDQLARVVVVDHLHEDLFWPESSLDLDDVPDWVADRVDVDPVDVKVDQYHRFGNIREHHLASDVRSQVRRERRGDG